jgi:hypothetical protein
MYAIVTPLLYREPIVQDLGLFMQGIEKPLPAGTTSTYNHSLQISSDEDLPVHKLHALALVRNLHLVHASSSNAVTPQLCTTNKAYEFPSSDLCHADKLGRADLDGWRDANTIIKKAKEVHGESFPIFQHVEHLTLGAWDDGRWSAYGARTGTNPQGGLMEGSMVDHDIKTVLRDLKACLEILRSKHTCRRPPMGPYSTLPPNIGLVSESSSTRGISIVHATSLRDIRLYDSYPGPVRVYANVGLFELYETSMVHHRTELDEPFYSFEWLLYPPRQVRGNVPKGTLAEICIEPKSTYHKATDVEKQRQVDLAVKVKAALEEFHKEVVERKGKERLWGGDVRILVGDEATVCPCCGAT